MNDACLDEMIARKLHFECFNFVHSASVHNSTGSCEVSVCWQRRIAVGTN